jgi:hypothetical protein
MRLFGFIPSNLCNRTSDLESHTSVKAFQEFRLLHLYSTESTENWWQAGASKVKVLKSIKRRNVPDHLSPKSIDKLRLDQVK